MKYLLPLAFMALCSTGYSTIDTEKDPFLWLEEVESQEALDWVRAHNQKTLDALKADPEFESRKEAALKILNASDRILYGSIRGEWVYNFWRDTDHVQGIWRRTSLENYLNQNYEWDVLIDLDALSQEEEKHWVWKGVTFLSTDYPRCLVEISDGGKDAAELREFDVAEKAFVEDGFYIPEAKSNVTWEDEDTLLLSTDWGDDSLTESGYPRILKRLKRGESLKDAETLYTGAKSHVAIDTDALKDRGDRVFVLYDAPTFFSTSKFLIQPDKDPIAIPLPESSEVQTLFNGQMIVKLRDDWSSEGDDYPSGSLLAFDLADFLETGKIGDIDVLFTPTPESAINQVSRSQSAILLNINDNVTGKLQEIKKADNEWVTESIDLPPNGSVDIAFADAESDTAFIGYESFLIPDSLIRLDTRDGQWKTFQSLPARFDSSESTVEQAWATSADGTKIPYFVVRPKDMTYDGTNPTYLYGYGGFEISMTPYYLSTHGKLWIEKGGIYVVANIRGGGEFGPRWHQAALKENRQRAYDDFHAVAEDLIHRKITSPEYLGIGGGSNGGLLVGVAFTQRPDLYNAVFCTVPLLDMLRYHELPPGASWIGEYGDPRIPEEHDFIAKYSPYQNLNRETTYPKVFFYTSTKDDRVHPAHARKMAAKMEAMGHPFYYFERIEGGHAGGANLEQYAELYALQYCYLFEMLTGHPHSDS